MTTVEENVPLSGIRVVDLTRILAGPFCTMLLADMGAEVVKIETPGQGDPLRGQGVIRDGLSWYFAAFNRNKQSLTLNLRHEEARAAQPGLHPVQRVPARPFQLPVLRRAVSLARSDLRPRRAALAR